MIIFQLPSALVIRSMFGVKMQARGVGHGHWPAPTKRGEVIKKQLELCLYDGLLRSHLS